MQIIFFIVCFIATTMGAISGIGGGVIIKPVLDAISDFGASPISFMSGCTVLAMSIVSLLKARNSGVKLELKTITPLAIGAAVGGVFGKSVFSLILTMFASNFVSAIQSAMLIIITIGVYIFVANKAKIKTLKVSKAIPSAAIGVALGIISAFLGIGGGPINIAILTYFFTMNSKVCALSSIYVILFSQSASFISTVATKSVPTFDGVVLTAMVIGGILGGFVGSSILKKFSNEKVDKLFKCMMIFIILISAYNFVMFLI